MSKKHISRWIVVALPELEPVPYLYQTYQQAETALRFMQKCENCCLSAYITSISFNIPVEVDETQQAS